MTGTRLPNEFRGRGIRWKSLDRPDETRPFPHGIGAFVDLDSLAIGRAVLEPGWRWSTDLKPLVGTEMCELHHLHVLVSGRMAFQMDGGAWVTKESRASGTGVWRAGRCVTAAKHPTTAASRHRASNARSRRESSVGPNSNANS